MMKVLVTAFEPFGKDSLNASLEAVRRLPEEVAGAALIKRQLPVAYNRAGEVLRLNIETIRPDIVLCTGQAGMSRRIRVEKVGLNWRAAKRPDNDGILYTGEKIFPEGETAYFATLPVEAIAEAIGAADIPVRVSYSAGTYVCNTVLYTLLAYLTEEHPETPGGFIHVPCCEGQAGIEPERPFMSLAEMTRALSIAVRTAVEMWR